MSDDISETNAVELATELTIAWLGNPNTRISADEVPAFLRRMHETVSGLTQAAPDVAAADQVDRNRYAIARADHGALVAVGLEVVTRRGNQAQRSHRARGFDPNDVVGPHPALGYGDRAWGQGIGRQRGDAAVRGQR